ncbi:MAG: hypothetical protein EZS28_028043 [Streblomastix strix]|uniref:HECT domain-containing protein n=1 Tax=Streblomastix strix TaxID=222440 RepID=A0A5J4V126_9EUKA|nr:MAG: hypothetical protein EZS28_028043 [Streblomastix strix]
MIQIHYPQLLRNVAEDGVMIISAEKRRELMIARLNLYQAIQFVDEAGIDDGGLRREWIYQYFENVIKEENGVFKLSGIGSRLTIFGKPSLKGIYQQRKSPLNGKIQWNDSLNEDEVQYQILRDEIDEELLPWWSVGVMLGYALLENVTIPLRLDFWIWRMLLGQIVSLLDKGVEGNEIQNNMRQVIQLEGGGEYLMTNFEITIEEKDEQQRKQKQDKEKENKKKKEKEEMNKQQIEEIGRSKIELQRLNEELLMERESKERMKQENEKLKEEDPSDWQFADIDGIQKRITKKQDKYNTVSLSQVMEDGIWSMESEFYLPSGNASIGIVKDSFNIPVNIAPNASPNYQNIAFYGGSGYGGGNIYYKGIPTSGVTGFGNNQKVRQELDLQKGTLHFFLENVQQPVFIQGIHEKVRFIFHMYFTGSTYTIRSLKKLAAPSAVQMSNQQAIQW